MLRLTGQAAQRAAKLGHWVARLLFLLLLVASVVGAGLSWLLAQGPLDMSWLLPRIEAELNAGAGGTHWSIGRAALAWEGFRGELDRPLDLALEEVRATDSHGVTIARLPRLLVSLSIRQLLLGHVAPRAIELRGLELRAIREADGSLTVDPGNLAPRAEEGRAPEGETRGTALTDILAELARPAADDDAEQRTAFSQLRRVVVRNAALRIRDRLLHAEWLAPDATFVLLRAAQGGATATAEMVLHLGSQAVPVSASAVIGKAGQDMRLEGRMGAFDPATLAHEVPALDMLAAADLPVTVAGNATFDSTLALREAQATATLGAGKVLLGRGSTPVASASITASGNMQALQVTRFAAALPPSKGPASNVSGSARITRNADGIAAEITLGVDQADFATLADLWPEGVGGKGTRPWITENITAGQARNLTAKLSLTSDPAFADPQLTHVEGGLDGHDLTVHWLRPVPPLEHGEARLNFVDPDTVEIIAKSGRQGAIALQSGTMRITGLSAKDQFADIGAELDGKLADVLALLGHPKLQLLSRRPVPLHNPAGQVHGRVDVAVLPLEADVSVDDVHLQAQARITDAHLGGIAAGRDLEHGMLDLTANNDALSVAGTASVAGIPGKLQVDMDFRAGGPTQVIQTIAFSARPDAAQLGKAGLDLGDMLTGPVQSDLVWRTRRNGSAEMALKTDLTQAAAAFPRLNFSKPAGKPAQATATVKLDHDRIVSVDPIKVLGSGLDIQGRVGFANGRPANAVLSRAMLGPATDVRADITFPPQEGGAWRIALAGTSLDASAEFQHQNKPAQPASAAKQPEKPGPRYNIDAQLDRLAMGDGRALHKVRLRAESDGTVMRALSLSGQSSAAGGAFTLAITPAGNGRRLSGHAADAGGLLNALDLVRDMQGGTMTLSGSYDDSSRTHPLAGRAEIADFRMSKAPALAKLLEAMTLYGLMETVQGPGLRFTRLEAPFQLADDTLDLTDARAFNPALGMTAKGRIDLARQRCEITGTIVPAYFFNSLLGNIPLVGRLFSPEPGGGLFAATYGLHGDCNNPSVGVNPLAALTPGFLRGLFGIFDSDGSPGAAQPQAQRPQVQTPQAQTPQTGGHNGGGQ